MFDARPVMSAIVFEKSPVAGSVAETTTLIPFAPNVVNTPLGFVVVKILALDMINPFCNCVEPPAAVRLPVIAGVVIVAPAG